MLTTKQAAAHLGMTPEHFRSLLCTGRGPTPALRAGKGPGHAYHFEADELERWASERKSRRSLDTAKQASATCIAAWDKVVANRGDLDALTAAEEASANVTQAWRVAVTEHGYLTMTDDECGVFTVPTLFSAAVKLSDFPPLGYSANEAGVRSWFACCTNYPWAVWRGGLPVAGRTL